MSVTGWSPDAGLGPSRAVASYWVSEPYMGLGFTSTYLQLGRGGVSVKERPGGKIHTCMERARSTGYTVHTPANSSSSSCHLAASCGPEEAGRGAIAAAQGVRVNLRKAAGAAAALRADWRRRAAPTSAMGTGRRGVEAAAASGVEGETGAAA